MEQMQSPVFDFEKLSALGEEERAAAVAEYTAAIEANARTAAAAEYDAELRALRYESVKSKMSLDNTLPHFGERLGAIEEIIAANSALGAMSDEEKLRTAYYIDRGKSAGEAPSAAELLNLIKENPDAMRLCEAAILEKLRRENPPALSSTSGSASVPLTPKAKPKNLSEASALARQAFGI